MRPAWRVWEFWLEAMKIDECSRVEYAIADGVIQVG
jgi:hypothetical protein